MYKKSGKKISNVRLATTPSYDLRNYLFLQAGTYYFYAYSAYESGWKRQTTIKSYDLRMTKIPIPRSTTTINFRDLEDHTMDMQYIESAIMANEDKVALKYKVRVKNSGYFGFHMQMPNYTMKATLKNSAGKSITLRDRTKGKLIFCRSTKEIKPGTYYATVTVTRVSASKSKYLGDVFHLDLGNWYTIRDLWEVDE